MNTQTDPTPPPVLVRLRDAISGHDVDAMAECFEPEYVSELPTHPERGFRGRERMRENWANMFRLLPDIDAVLLAWAARGDAVWAEWEWRGTQPDGGRRVMRGVSIQGVRRDRIAWVRIYIEPVQDGGGGSEDVTTARGPEALMLLIPPIVRNRGFAPFAIAVAR